MSTKITENGKVVEIQENGETVVDIQDLKDKQKNIKGNPDMKEMFNQIINYLEKEG